MDDKIEPKTEQTLPSKTEPVDDELATLLPVDDELATLLPADGEQLLPTFIAVNDTDEATVVASSHYLAVHSTSSSIAEKTWNPLTHPSLLNTEIINHGGHHDEVGNTTSADTIVDSDIETKPPSTEEKEKQDENLNPEYDYIFCMAAIKRTTSNNLKVFEISRIDTNVKLDLKSDGSSLNGYAADHSGSSTNSIMCGQGDEPFLVPKNPRDSFMSLSSSGSSTGVLLHHSKSKPNNILSSKNFNTYPENLVCQSCNHVYPKVSDKFNLDCKDLSKAQLNTCLRKSKQKRKSKRSIINNDESSNKTLKKTKTISDNTFDEKTDIKIEEIQDKDVPNDDLVENKPNDPISFNKGDKVFAYWVSDKLFYPSIIDEIVPPKFKVKFMSDHVIKSLNIDALVHSSALKKGSPIAILDTVSQELRVGEIDSINFELNTEDTYTIDLGSEKVTVAFDKLILSMESARLLQDKSIFKNYQRLSMSNVSEGKRIRSTRSTNVNYSKNNKANTKNESSKRKNTGQRPEPNKKRKCLFPDEVDLRNIPSTSTGIMVGDYDNISFNVSSDSEFDQIREDLTTIDINKIKNSDVDSEHSSPDKIDRLIKSDSSEAIQVFKDLNFVLTYAKYKRTPMTYDSDKGVDISLPSSESVFAADKVRKRHLETLITKHGGNVYRYLNVLPKSYYKSTYLITDTPSQTCNFYLCLSLGIPAYHHKYISKAVKQKLSFPDFLCKNKIEPISNGFCTERKTFIYRSPDTVHSAIFSGFIVYLALSNEDKTEFFACLLKLSGAIVYTTWENGVRSAITRYETIIVTDEYCPVELERAKVPKLSVSWVIQSLICESVRPYNARENYIAISDDY